MDLTAALSLIFVCSIFIFLARWAIRRRRKHKLFRRLGIPGPEPGFLTGNMTQLHRGLAPHHVIEKWLKEYGDVFGYFVGEVPYIVIKDLDMLKEVLVKDFPVFMNRPESPLSTSRNGHNHLAHLEGRRWKEVRSILTPTFTSGKIKLMMEIMKKKVDDTVDVVREKAKNGKVFDIYPAFQRLTLDVIAQCAFAMKTNCQKDSNDKLFIAVRNSVFSGYNWVHSVCFIFPLLTPMMVVIDRYLTMTGRNLSFLVDHLKMVIKTRKENWMMKSNDFLQLVIEANRNESKIKMSDGDIIANSSLFLFAAYETSSMALAFTFHLLIKHPDIQEKLYQEIAQAEDCSYHTIHNLLYLDQVFSESLRFYPPVTGFLSRTCLEDHQVGSINIPKGTNVLAPIWSIHHDPHLWPDPEKFDPDRFSPENKTSAQSMTYLTFGAGPRSCIGSRFAQLEAKLALFKLIKEFRFEACEKTDDPLTLICPTVILNPAKGIYLRAVPRSSSLKL